MSRFKYWVIVTGSILLGYVIIGLGWLTWEHGPVVFASTATKLLTETGIVVAISVPLSINALLSSEWNVIARISVAVLFGGGALVDGLSVVMFEVTEEPHPGWMWTSIVSGFLWLLGLILYLFLAARSRDARRRNAGNLAA